MQCLSIWKRGTAIAATALLSLGIAGPGFAQAEEEYVDPNTVLDSRWSVMPMAGLVLSDSSDLDSGISGGILAAKPLTHWFSYELGADYSNLETSNAGDYERISGRLGGVLYPFRPYFDDSAAFQPFLGGGVHLSSIDFLAQSTSAVGFYASLGAQQKLNDRLSFTLLGRYQVDDVGDSGPVIDQTYYTWQVLAGLRIALGSKPSDRFRDADGDGVPDGLDKCPDTPSGVQVDARGCPLDGDGDGVPDHLDQCPDTPRGVKVDATGCPIDSDGDGVPDYLDKCPDTAPGVAVDAHGCPLVDSDGDGIPDAYDKCPDTPKGIATDEDGCPLDSDGDGIPDHLDECPNTPAGLAVLPDGCALVGDCRRPRPGEAVDANGCAMDRGFILRGVKFEFDSAILTVEAKQILDKVSVTLSSYPDVDVELGGHTDSIGTAGYNLGLSERRALAVKEYLMRKGIKGARMTPVGYGLTVPIADNSTDAGREENRRVELTPQN